MAMPKHLTRAAMAAALGLALLSGCRPALAGGTDDPPPDWRHEIGVSPNCSGGDPSSRYVRFDINNDRVPDWFYVFRCPEAAATGRGDQLEVIDGKTDTQLPGPLGRHPVIHPDAGVRILEGCLLFTHQRVIIVGSLGGRAVVEVGTWDGKKVAIEPLRPHQPVPCGDARWANGPWGAASGRTAS